MIVLLAELGTNNLSSFNFQVYLLSKAFGTLRILVWLVDNLRVEADSALTVLEEADRGGVGREGQATCLALWLAMCGLIRCLLSG